MINALIFVAIVGVMTFVLVLLFKYGVMLSPFAQCGHCQCLWSPFQASKILVLCRIRHARHVPSQCVRFIYGYMGLAGFSIFFFLTGVIALQLLEKANARLDAFSFLFFLYNFAVRPPPPLPILPAHPLHALHAYA